MGKTSACELLFLRESRYIVMESDLLWRDVFDTPEDNYREYRETWMRVCASISQIGLPAVLCGCGLPEQFEVCDAREYFTDIHYIAVVCAEGTGKAHAGRTGHHRRGMAGKLQAF